MPASSPRRLRQADHAAVTARWHLGQSIATIAVKLACSPYQVRRVLVQYDLLARPAAPRVLPAAQVALIAQFQASPLSVVAVAKRLGVDWRRVSHELRGLKLMSPRRLVQLARVLTQANTPKTQTS
ncbi:hypothetical protein GKZ68_00415 [Hymenobacter sp. BRD128]|uniref:hypothetical protein n=1 Tax=Hymenobacter sp. BRD128 TaxID=2675878 RepID=UPI001562F834|nr:hypothetical protein [Hymenobacter sp. BRD128]QKG55234.1 hypothetical protein GKZ68_00415 [Hymenobacter sp. BRD128]